MNSMALSFNQDCTSLAIGSKHGFQLYSLGKCNLGEVGRIDFNDADKDIYIAERLFNSSLVALVSRSNPNYLKICHFKKRSEICSHSYPSDILSVKLNRQRLVLSLADRYCIHNIRDMKMTHELMESVTNTTGLCALSVIHDTALLAYPSSAENGRLSIYDTIDLRPVVDIDAHNSPLAAIAFNYQADMIATASAKGTVIRTFSTVNGDKLLEFRRGLKRCVTISSLAFSQDGMFLAASSNTQTVHIFKIHPDKEKEDPVGWTSYLTTALTSSAVSLMPSSVGDALNAWRAFATARLNEGGKRTVTGIVTIKRVSYVMVADTDSNIYVFSLDEEDGGECELVTSKSMDFSNSNSANEDDQHEEVLPDLLLAHSDNIHDVSYAYKLKREKRVEPSTISQELNEIVDNVPMLENKDLPDVTQKLKLDDSDEFPSI